MLLWNGRCGWFPLINHPQVVKNLFCFKEIAPLLVVLIFPFLLRGQRWLLEAFSDSSYFSDPLPPLTSLLASIPCLYVRYWIYVERGVSPGGKKKKKKNCRKCKLIQCLFIGIVESFEFFSSYVLCNPTKSQVYILFDIHVMPCRVMLFSKLNWHIAVE